MQTPDNRPQTSGPSSKNSNYKNVLIGFLSLAVVALFIFLMIDKNNNNFSGSQANQSSVYQDDNNATTSDEELALRKSFDESLVKIDSLNAANEELNKELAERKTEINKSKEQIRSILNSRKLTSNELAKAKDLIASLNEKITSMEEQINTLTQDNETLKQEKEVLVQQNQKLTEDLTASNDLNVQLTEKVDVGSTLNASNFSITPLKVKDNDKEKLTYKAKRVDKMVISFNVNNRIAEPGTKDIYVVVTDPNGKLISSEKLGSGTFTSREQGDVMYTTKVAVDVETAKPKMVEFNFMQDEKYIPGTYHFLIYQNGFKIGEGTSDLKKGGLFS